MRAAGHVCSTTAPCRLTKVDRDFEEDGKTTPAAIQTAMTTAAPE